MARLSVDPKTVASWCAFYEELAAKGYPPASGAVFVLHSRCVLGLKYQRVMLARGLSGVISSDDGKRLTVFYRDAKAWLASRGGPVVKGGSL